jgi:hypothetical protein
MQRWIALGVVAFLLLLGGSYFGLKAYKQSRPYPIWVPLPINAELDKEKRDEACANLRNYVLEEQRMLAIARDLQLAGAWSQPSDEAAAAELKKRIFVRIGSANTPMGDVPAIHVGLSGTRKEIPMTEKIVARIMEDVKIAIGMPNRTPGE